ncbi:hypothetical protein HBB16_03455 [Pseudonocardia sp. MCCB 268]|nr:hypothetical protein [Pseudonocardia cytotoxica]
MSGPPAGGAAQTAVVLVPPEAPPWSRAGGAVSWLPPRLGRAVATRSRSWRRVPSSRPRRAAQRRCWWHWCCSDPGRRSGWRRGTPRLTGGARPGRPRWHSSWATTVGAAAGPIPARPAAGRRGWDRPRSGDRSVLSLLGGVRRRGAGELLACLTLVWQERRRGRPR